MKGSAATTSHATIINFATYHFATYIILTLSFVYTFDHFQHSILTCMRRSLRQEALKTKVFKLYRMRLKSGLATYYIGVGRDFRPRSRVENCRTIEELQKGCRPCRRPRKKGTLFQLSICLFELFAAVLLHLTNMSSKPY